MKKIITGFYLLLAIISSAQETEKLYLSGTDKDNRIDWEFYCTEGLKSRQWTSIPVPSNWECEGFGSFDYGHVPDSIRGKEKGLYRYHFSVPENWKEKTVSIIFEGSMTDTEVIINGKAAGPIHQGAFYRFSYDITNLLKYEKQNLLEVTVAKHSSNESVNEAERQCDFWLFGGIYRPVYLEAKPKEHIQRIALDAKANGMLTIDAYLQGIQEKMTFEAQVKTTDGKYIGNPITHEIPKHSNYIRLEEEFQNIKTWTPETPNLYLLEVSLKRNKQILHKESERFGFRTVEIKDRDGVYINGVKIKFKGINRHSFWPTSGRTTSKQISIDDANLIKDMNMNAVRMSHYPPDVHFLEVCDSIGLFVLDELAGWQTAYDTEVGSILAKETILRDMNHPSVVIWDNGNEGGWNTELDHWFDELDIQKRPLIHPYEVFRDTDTDHYQEYNAGTGVHQNGNKVVFPTEFLHGLYDGGHGAGLEDYWNQMWYNPISAGGFLWDFSDQAVVRNDLGGILDTDGNHGADGILGPYREKEASFYTVKEIWAPVFFEKRFITPEFDGQFNIENRYHYTNLKDCRFTCQWVNLPTPGNESKVINHREEINSPDIKPGDKGTLILDLPDDFTNSDVLYITAFNPEGKEIYTWSWPITLPYQMAEKIVPMSELASRPIVVKEDLQCLILTSDNNLSITWDKTDGLLKSVINNGKTISFNNGPVLISGETSFDSLVHFQNENYHVVEAIYSGAMKLVRWTFFPDGWLKLEVKYNPPNHNDFMGISFNYPESMIKGMEWLGAGPYRVWKNRMKGNTLDVWQKQYNNTITGESEFIYPEFKGYHKDFYWVTIQSKEEDFDIICASENIFLRMLTPESPKGLVAERIAPPFPKGDISFMHGINPIGTKIFSPDKLGPMSQKNIFCNRRGDYTKDIELYFNFTMK